MNILGRRKGIDPDTQSDKDGSVRLVTGEDDLTASGQEAPPPEIDRRQSGDRRATPRPDLDVDRRTTAGRSGLPRPTLALAYPEPPREEERQGHISEEEELVFHFRALEPLHRSMMLTFARQASSLPPEKLQALNKMFGLHAAPPYIPPPLPAVNSGYTKLSKRAPMSSADLIAFTREIWGPWLKCCNATLAKDAMTRQDLKQLDPLLFSRLTKQLSPKELGSLIQTKSMRIETDIEELGEVRIKNAATALRKLHRMKTKEGDIENTL